jgi:crotonobetainyl-CoA:carnitine CoA-transferase CaiB-like acyl-CoA transferase
MTQKAQQLVNTEISNNGPLQGLFVVDMSTMMAGPFSAMMLADFGATVVKVEEPKGDPSRKSGWPVNGTSVWWRVFGRNKETVTLNLKHHRGHELMLKLIERADVLIENMRPGKLEALDLSPEALQKLNPGLVILRVTGWGQDGPYSDRASFGTQAEAMSSFVYMNGQPDGPPTLPAITLADNAAGYLGAFAIMAALWHREKNPAHKGQVIDMSLFEALFGFFGPFVPAYEKLGVVIKRKGSRSAAFAPKNIYTAKDGGFVAISCAAEQVVPRLFETMGRPELYKTEKYSTVQARFKNIDELDGLIQDWIGQHDRDDIIARLTKSGVPAAPIYSIEDVFADPHFKARELIKSAPADDIGSIAMANVAPRLSDTPGALRWSGRALGADNHKWFVDELGLSEAEFAELKKAGAI